MSRRAYCHGCGEHFEVLTARGRFPKLCPACKLDGPPKAERVEPKGDGDPGTEVNTATLLRLSVRFARVRGSASTADLATRFQQVQDALIGGDPEALVDRLLDLAGLCTVLADQRAR